MKFSPSDIDALHAPAAMAAVLERYAAPRGAVNGKPRYTCPVHAHKHPEKPHLRIEAGKGGQAVAVCDSYGVIGDVFSLIGELEGIGDFPARVQAVADLAGCRLCDGEPKARGGKRGGRGKATGKPRPESACNVAGDAPPECLPPDKEQEIFRAVWRLQQCGQAIKRHAKALGLPACALMAHTMRDCAPLGLLGLDEAGRLMYVYTMRDAGGAWHVPMYKTRALPGESPRFRAYGKKQGLWGAEAIHGRGAVIIAEGESDCLAIRDAVSKWLDDWIALDPDSYPIHGLPVCVAKPDAGTFKAEWAKPLRGHEVILCIDGDEAGRKGAARTAQILHAAGVQRVGGWTPPDGFKDARDFYVAAGPLRLADDIFLKKETMA